MDYKSNRSDMFKAWLEEMNEDKIEMLVDLERFARLLVHVSDLTGDIDGKAYAALARTARNIRFAYEETNDSK